MARIELEGEWIEDPLGLCDEVFALRATRIENLPLKRGKVKDVYDLGYHLLVLFTDRVSAFDVVLPDPVPHKGFSLASTSALLLKGSSRIFPNHFVEQVDVNAIKVRKAERIDVEWIVRGYLYGSLWREYKRGERQLWGYKLPDGMVLAEQLPEPLVTPTTKSEVGHDKPITREEAIDRKLVSRDEWMSMEEAAIKLFEFYSGKLRTKGLILADIKVEFGRLDGDLIQIDEPPTHDSARIWIEDVYREGENQADFCLDKEFLREALRKMGFSGEGSPPRLPKKLIWEVSKRAVGLYSILSGKARPKDLDLRPLDEVLRVA